MNNHPIKLFLPEADNETIRIIDTISKLKYFKKKEIVFHEGEKGEYIFLLIKGLIKLYKITEDGQEVIVHFVKKGNIFAEIILYMDNTYPVTAEALKDSEVLCINAKKMYDIFTDNPKFCMRFIGILISRIKSLFNKIENITTLDAKERVFNYLKNNSNNGIFTFNISKKNIAMTLKIRPETFSRILKRLENEQKIIILNNKIKII